MITKKHLNRQIVKTDDGSHTLIIPELNEHYHSIHGAIQESMHVFIQAGFNQLANASKLSILEIGFGTGLNTLLTFIHSKMNQQFIEYCTIEKYPLVNEEFMQLNYASILNDYPNDLLYRMHNAPWKKPTAIDSEFTLLKLHQDLLHLQVDNTFDLVYFDAFGPDKQPDLWTEDVFKTIYGLMNRGAILTTYSAKGQVRRNMKNAGFKVERIAGPPGKREMLRAKKQ
ncbi:MAG: SAM-dependent methyltransferase [Bacteroidetes bacterium HGW-Bacteroidetes-4]|jgi:tRNA U34 5-methylaminomethyl-2-thiouridine-forming methyltransferase MnmC|nr:MAG: SAM-dependent methyltransferase [Bacteroidetes bacterium HGW-Bacteroidetes-4]